MKKLIYITLLTSIFYTCNKDCENNNKTFYVYSSDLPFIILYTDTSRVKFIKNGTDTLTYISQGLKETYLDGYISNTQSGGCGTNAKYQRYSLKMQNSNDEFFQITQYANNEGADKVKLEINSLSIDGNRTNHYMSNYPPILSCFANNIKYDSVSIFSLNQQDTFIFKPRIGIVKMKINNNIYEILR
jgi:hypothetical protein